MNTSTSVLVSTAIDAIAEFCRRWNIVEFALFGSVLRDDFRPDSDIDLDAQGAQATSEAVSQLLRGCWS